MSLKHLFPLILSLYLSSTLAARPEVGSSLPPLEVADRGELVISGDDAFDFVPWHSDKRPQAVHVVQYFGATLSDRDIFEPFTDLLQENFEDGVVHVTTILNLDAAMWGTKGMVIKELKKNKKKHPGATMVADADAAGTKAWELGKNGTALMIIDAQGTVLFFNQGALDETQLAPTIELIRENLAPAGDKSAESQPADV